MLNGSLGAGPTATLRFRRRALFTSAEPILEPRRRNDEQWRQEETKQRVQPDQRDIEAAESQTNPERAKRSVSFHAGS